MSRDKMIELTEWVVWTTVVAFLGGLMAPAIGVDISQLQAAAVAALNACLQAVLMIARWRLSVLPQPGAGLPGVKALQRPKPATHDELVELGRLPDDILNGLLDG